MRRCLLPSLKPLAHRPCAPVCRVTGPDLYEAGRGCWVLGARADQEHYALFSTHGIVRQAIRIEAITPAGPARRAIEGTGLKAGEDPVYDGPCVRRLRRETVPRRGGSQPHHVLRPDRHGLRVHQLVRRGPRRALRRARPRRGFGRHGGTSRRTAPASRPDGGRPASTTRSGRPAAPERQHATRARAATAPPAREPHRPLCVRCLTERAGRLNPRALTHRTHPGCGTWAPRGLATICLGSDDLPQKGNPHPCRPRHSSSR